MDVPTMTQFMTLLITLQSVLKQRRRLGLNFLFGKNEHNHLRDCLKALRNCALSNDEEGFREIGNIKFLDYLKCAGRTDPHGSFKENLDNLKELRMLLDEINVFYSSGVAFGRKGYDVSAQLQQVTIWMRQDENILTIRKNQP